ncbi:hypothetical protein [Falsigemmobacter faecalis]|uniref:Uncharacterized protein n=1 Tax=Falsigemmobacter faecalis TaxID=2488730 RepID=A0A3P3D3P2_9RHOB|nr:hypothetical protein [Falsigemmobacter faecalis]RRH69043.1 hypothetical protein EG244_18970 [Falsigemmobacter faecalis]
MLGLGLSLSGLQRGSGGRGWTPADLIKPGQPGFWAGGFAPPAFTPDLLLTRGQPGFWANLQGAVK